MNVDKPELRDYQVKGVEFLKNNKRALLGDEPGLGKSRQLIEASTGQTLVVAPAMVLFGGTWEEEIEKWADDPKRFTCVAYTSLNERHGRTILPKASSTLKKNMWDTIIIDEAHYIKNPDAKRTKAVLDLIQYNFTSYVWLATGTPVLNWAHELFQLVKILHPEKVVPGGDLNSKWRWYEKWFDISLSPFNNAKVIGDVKGKNYDGFVRENLGSRFLMRRRDDVLTELPVLTKQVVKIPMTKQQDKAYKKLRDDFVLELTEGKINTIAWTSVSKHVMLDRLCTSLTEKESGKFNRLKYDLENIPGKIVIMAHYKQTVMEAAKIAGNAPYITGDVPHKERREAINRFKTDPDCNVLCGSLETLSEGLNLTCANTIILVEMSYKPSRNEQAIRRIHRMGQEKPCLVLDYVSVRYNSTTGTVDTKKRKLLNEKTDQQMRTITAAMLLED